MAEALPLFESKGVRIAMIAGESSGDLLGAALIQALCRRVPESRFAGIGGKRMQAEGFRSVVPMDWLSVMGYAEVLKRLPKLWLMRRRLIRQLLRERPDVVIGIDAPDFNLAVEHACKAAGIPVIHYASPSIWAWRGERIHSIKRSTDHVLCLFPMEPGLYREVSLDATFIGHPLADQIPVEIDIAAARATLDLPADATVIALLPGSRVSEIRRIGPVMIETARLLLRTNPALRFVVPLATEETRTAFLALRDAAGRELPIEILPGQSHAALAAADVVLVKSGTSTLEAALFKKPMVITYKVSRLSAWIMKRKAYLPWVGLPNVLIGETVVPELLQDEASAPNLAAAVRHWLEDAPARETLRERFTALHLQLKQNAAESAADVVVGVLRKGGAI